MQAYACTEKQEGNSKLREIARNRSLLLFAVSHNLQALYARGNAAITV